MKISIDWLSDYVEISKSPEEIGDILSDLGFPIEEIVQVGDDIVLDVEVTSNRGDCLSHIGVARELAAATGKILKLPVVDLPFSDKDVSSFASVHISEPELCHRYTARIIEGVKVGPSPLWMKERIEAIGLRSVNNVVDASNYAMMETGQPCHTFDYDKMSGEGVHVRKAIPGELMVSIDGTKCELNSEMLVIADEDKPIAIAGVMGGLSTEVSEDTSTILLEDAHFAPVSVRTTGRKLGLNSDSSFRFERHVDEERIEWASQRTAQLIAMVAGGKVAKGCAQEWVKEPEKKDISMRLARLKSLMGFDIPSGIAVEILTSLGFEPKIEGDKILCNSPSWRHDISREVDLIEEVIRCYGYDKIPVVKKITIEVARPDERRVLTNAISGYMNSCGAYETLSVSFCDESQAKLFGQVSPKDHLGVKDVTRKSANLLRQSLIGSLLDILKSNYNMGNRNCRLFEIADTFVTGSGGLDERTKIAMVCNDDLRFVRSVVDGIGKILDRDVILEFKPCELKWAVAGAEIYINGVVVGTAGVISKSVSSQYGFKDITPCAFELDLQTLIELKSEAKPIKHLPKFPSVSRDLSLILDEQTTWTQIEETAKENAPRELENIRFVDIYRGKPISVGNKSVTLELTFRDDDGTLTHERVDGFESLILDNLKTKLKAELRAV